MRFSFPMTGEVLLALSLGVALAVLQALPEIVSNRHLQHGAYRLVFLLLADRVLLWGGVLGAAAIAAAGGGSVLRRFGVRPEALVVATIALTAVGLAAYEHLDAVATFLQQSPLGQFVKERLPDEADRRVLLRNRGRVLGGSFVLVAALALLAGRRLLTRATWPGRLLPGRRAQRALSVALGLAAILLLAGRVLVGGAAGPDRPNIVLITLDTLRADHLGGYGYPRPTSPHLDALARRAVVYRDARSTSPWTAPAHASLFTGEYPSEHGLHSFFPVRPDGGNVYSLSPAHECLAEILRDRGYATGAIVSNFLYLKRKFRFDQGFETYDVVVGRGDRVRYRDAAEMSGIVLPWLRARRGQPFFLFLNYMDPHAPYRPPPPLDRRFEGATGADTGELMRQAYAPVLSQERPLRADERAHLVSQYDGEIRFLDAELGKLLRELDRLGLADNTLLVITSDHGEYFGEHALLEHSREVYEPVLRVPLLVRGPGGAPRIDEAPFPGNRVFDLVREVAGVGGGIPEERASATLAESFFARPKDLRAAWRHRFERVRRAFYFDEYKLIWSSDGRHELYELARDPEEERDLAAERPELVAELVGRAEAWIAEVSARAADRPRSEVGPEPADEEALRALGYL